MRGGPIRRRLAASVREIVFGLEDSLVSTLGTVTGVAVGSGDSFIVLLTGTVLVFVEALSMAAGSYLSSKSAEDFHNNQRRKSKARVLRQTSPSPMFAGVVMGIFYIFGGFVPLIPYLLFPIAIALPMALALSVVCLFGVGVLKAKLTNSPVLKSGIEMLVVSLGAAVLGFLIGRAVSLIAGVQPIFS